MKLLVAILALNEKDSIASLIERCLAARQRIVAESPVDEVETTIVSDGSIDRTIEFLERGHNISHGAGLI
jgi:hypothetical protein